MRSWLNGEFYEKAFNDEEKRFIFENVIAADKNNDDSTNPKMDIKDKVFLLSIEEVQRHFNNNESRQCKPTAYAIANHVYTNKKRNCWWWLRSLGNDSSHAACVTPNGLINSDDHWVSDQSDSVRPCLRINLNLF